MWPSLSLLTNFSLKSILSGMSIATPDCFKGSFAWMIFFHPFTLSQYLFLSVRYVSCKQQLVWFCFLIQHASLCLLIGALRPLTFSVNIDKCVVFPVISLYVLIFTFTPFLLCYSAWTIGLILLCIFLTESCIFFHVQDFFKYFFVVLVW
jgi:hypothetical protein